MNELTYYVLATVSNGTGENLWDWTADFGIERKQDPKDTREWFLGLLRTLLAKGLVAVGDYESDGPDRAGWAAWHGTPEQIVQRVAAIYRIETEAGAVPFWPCYLMNTPTGDALFEQERNRRLSAGVDPVADDDLIWDAAGNVIEPNGDEVVV